MRRLAVFVVLAAAACQQGDPNLSSTEEKLVTTLPSSHDFGSLQVGQTSAPFTVTIAPSGTSSNDTVSSITENCPDFAVNAPGLPAQVYRTCDTCCPGGGLICPGGPVACCIGDSQSYDFDTTFTPTVAGAVSCTVTISLNGGTSMKTVVLTGTGTPPPINIVVNPGSVNFGDVRRNTDSSAVGLSVTNTGGGTMNVSSVSITSGFTIASGPTGGYPVGPGASQPYSILCHPTAIGPLQGTLVVNSDAPNNTHVMVPLSCNGIDSNLTIAPSPVMLPTTRVGEPVQATVQLQNSGNVAMQLEGVTISGTDLTMTGGGAMQLGPGASTSVTVTFGATAKESATGTLVASYDGGQQRSAQLSAQALGTSMSMSDDHADFGPVCPGQMPSHKFSILGNDDGSFKINAISTPDLPFSVMAPALPATVEGNGMSTFELTVTAAPTTEGHQVSTITVTTDIPGGTPATINLSVDGLVAGVSPTPAMLDFGANPVDTTTIGQNVDLSNCSTAAITAMNARIEGPDAGEFAIVQQPMSAMIQPSSSASWLVVLQAHTAGTKQASFVVDYDGGTAMVPLNGEGLGVNGTGSGADTGEKSYYSCAAGGTGAGWPIAGVLLVVIRRRKRRV